MKRKEAEFVERRSAANDAKAALLEKARARKNDPEAVSRREEHAALAAAREEREEAKRLAAEQKRREDAEREAALAAERQAAEEAAKKAASEDLVARLLQDEAARKAQRDSRYAARQARKGR